MSMFEKIKPYETILQTINQNETENNNNSISPSKDEI